MELARAGFEDGVDVASAVAPLAGVVERCLHLEFLDHIGIWQRNVGGLGHVVVRCADSLDQVIVVVLALSVHDDADVATSQLRRGIQLALRTAGKRQQLLIVLRGQRQFPHGLRAERLAGHGIGRFHAGNLRGNLHLFGDRTGLERNGDFGGLRDAHFNARGLGLREPRFIHHHGVDSRGQQRNDKRSVRVCRNLAHQRLRASIKNLDFSFGNRAASGIHNCAADGPGRATLSVSTRAR